MRKAVMVEKEKQVFFCDLCGNEMETFDSCSICNREFCGTCSKDMKHTSTVWYPPCPICIKMKDKYFKKIQNLFKESEKLGDKGVALLHTWGEESKNQGKEHG